MAKKIHDSKNGYRTRRHSCFLLQYHLVLVTKYRHPVLTGDVASYLKEYTEAYFKEREMPVTAIEIMPDHVHILFSGIPAMDLAGFINAFKTCSSRKVRSKFQEELKEWYWKPYFWSRSYFIGSVSEHTSGIVKKYIEQQKSKSIQ